jgi:biotin carboxylase
VIVAVTDKELGRGGFIEVGHSQPSRCPADELREVARLVTELLDAVGLRNGPAHTEVKLTSRGPRIVESHNRIGGGRINELTEIVYGVDMERYALGARFGAVEPLDRSPEPRGGAAVRVITPDPGRVVAVTALDAVRADPAYVDLRLKVGPGDVVPPLTWNEDKVGQVVARGATAAEAIANAGRLAAAIHVRTEAVA